MSNWVATEIVSQAKLSKRSNVLKRFILIAKELWEKGNFHTSIAIVSSLNSNPVNRLKSTWKEVNKKYHKQFEDIESKSSPLRHYKSYRRTLESFLLQKKVCFPFLGVITKDVNDIDFGWPDTEQNGFINFEKMLLNYRSISSSKFFSLFFV